MSVAIAGTSKACLGETCGLLCPHTAGVQVQTARHGGTHQMPIPQPPRTRKTICSRATGRCQYPGFQKTTGSLLPSTCKTPASGGENCAVQQLYTYPIPSPPSPPTLVPTPFPRSQAFLQIVAPPLHPQLEPLGTAAWFLSCQKGWWPIDSRAPPARQKQVSKASISSAVHSSQVMAMQLRQAEGMDVTFCAACLPSTLRSVLVPPTRSA
jgi:hypothetical protein